MRPQHATLIAFAILLAASPALADPVCSKLAWPLDAERRLMADTGRQVQSGSLFAMPALLKGARWSQAFSLALKPAASATLPYPPQKAGDPEKFSGYVAFAVPAAGDYLVSLSTKGWIDVFQNGNEVNSTAHTSDTNCPGLRKSVRFPLAEGGIALEISDAPADHIAVAITPATRP